MKLSPAAVSLVAAAGIGATVLGFELARRGHRVAGQGTQRALPVSLAGALVLHVPRAQGYIALDGDLDDPGWQRASARTQAFVGPDGVSPARPHSEGRFVWADGYLYVGLYAADEDIHAKATEHDVPVAGDDVFHVVFSDGKTDHVLDVSPTGVLTDGARAAGSAEPLGLGWESDAHVSVEHDGTLNDGHDFDEEWVIEMAIPLESLGLRGERGETLGASMRRCDTLKSGVTSCGTWGYAETGDKPGGAKKAVLVLD